MSFRLDYEEPIFAVVKRLKQEHKELDRKLQRISNINDAESGKLKVAVSLLNAIETEILRHAVEEEARLARVILQASETRKKSDKSMKILREHRRIKEFFEDELPYLLEENSEKDARKKIKDFSNLIISHHQEEEKEVFPLALEAIQSS